MLAYQRVYFGGECFMASFELLGSTPPKTNIDTQNDGLENWVTS